MRGYVPDDAAAAAEVPDVLALAFAVAVVAVVVAGAPVVEDAGAADVADGDVDDDGVVVLADEPAQAANDVIAVTAATTRVRRWR